MTTKNNSRLAEAWLNKRFESLTARERHTHRVRGYRHLSKTSEDYNQSDYAVKVLRDLNRSKSYLLKDVSGSRMMKKSALDFLNLMIISWEEVLNEVQGRV